MTMADADQYWRAAMSRFGRDNEVTAVGETNVKGKALVETASYGEIRTATVSNVHVYVKVICVRAFSASSTKELPHLRVVFSRKADESLVIS